MNQSESADKPVVGVVGCGKQAEKHVPALHELGAAVQTADLDPAVGAAFAERFSTTNAASIEELIANPLVDAIDICTPTSSHFALAMSAIEAGKPFFVEKPLCATVEEAQALAMATQASGTHGVVGYVYRFAPALEALKAHLDQGSLGALTSASFRIGGAGNHQLWKHRQETDGGAVNEMLVHMLDLAMWFFGRFSSVEVIRKEQLVARRTFNGETQDVDAEDLVIVIAQCERGPELIIQADFLSRPFRQHVEVLGTNGSATASIVPNFGSSVVLGEAVGDTPAGKISLDHEPVNLHARQLQDLLSLIDDPGHAPRCPVDDSLHLMETLEKVRAHNQ